MDFRKCFIPACKNDSVNSSGKIFVKVREDLRKKWCLDAGVNYATKVIMYCCEDHIDPLVDLKNYHKTKLMNQEPILNAKAVLKNVTQKPEIPMVISEETELEKLLLLPLQDPIPAKKRKFEDKVKPSTSSTIMFPLKVQVGVQCKPIMVDKSTNFKSRESTASTTKVLEVQSQQSSTATPLYGCTSETEESTSEKIKYKL